jgi:hypothetical protein
MEWLRRPRAVPVHVDGNDAKVRESRAVAIHVDGNDGDTSRLA